MQRVAGVSWAKPDSDNAQFGKEILVACPNRGASCGRLCIRSLSLFQEMLGRRGTAFGLGACETEFRQPKKVAHCNWCSNLSKGSRANTRPGHVAAQSQRREASKRPDEVGFLQFGRCVRFQCSCRLEPWLNHSRASGRVRRSLM